MKLQNHDPKWEHRKHEKARTLSLPLQVTLRHGIQVRNVNINFSSAVTISTPLHPQSFSPSPHPTSHGMTNEFDPFSTPICSLSWLRHRLLPAFIKSDGLCVLRVPGPEEHRDTRAVLPEPPGPCAFYFLAILLHGCATPSFFLTLMIKSLLPPTRRRRRDMQASS